MDNNELYHYGIKGMKWGVRRYQNTDGSLTTAGRDRNYNRKNMKNADTQHLDKWGADKDHNILYISGKSGSGKSTAALAMSDSNTNVIHLDSYFELKNQRGKRRLINVIDQDTMINASSINEAVNNWLRDKYPDGCPTAPTECDVQLVKDSMKKEE